MEWRILRPNWFMQNFSESFFLPPILARGELPAPTGDARVSFIDSRDIAAVAVAALTGEGHAGQGYPLTGPESLTFAEVAQILSAASGRDIRHADVAPQQMAEIITGIGIPGDYAQILLGLFEGIRAGYSAPVTDVVPTITGRPAIPLAEYAKENAQVWAQH